MRSLLLALAFVLGLAGPPAASAQDVADPAAEEAFFTGIALLEAGDPAGAVAKFDQALRIDKGLRRVHFYRAQAWARLGDVDEARADAVAYEAFALSDGERAQLDELKAEIEERARQIGAAERPAASARPGASAPTPEGPDGIALLRAAEEALARGDCAAAAASAQDALSADNTLARAFLVKGLALECGGDLARARALITTYMELRAGLPEDPVAVGALARVEARLRGEEAEAEREEIVFRPLGSDPRIEGILGERFGLPANRVIDTRTRREPLPGVGLAEVGRPRITVGGSASPVERAWVVGDRGLAWSRLRVYERTGVESVSWFVRVFAEQYRAIERAAGAPQEVRGFAGTPEAPQDARQALAGKHPLLVRWKDGDGDTVSLRIGRCTVPRDVSRVHPDNAPCVEVVAASGIWKPSDSDVRATAAAQRIETAGPLRVDVSGGLGLGLAPTLWFRTDLPSAAAGGEFGLDLNVRGAVGAFVFGGGYALSVAGYSNVTDSVGPFADHRIMGYVGVRDRPRQRTMTDVLFGFGFAPETGGLAAAFGLRVIAQTRIAPIGRFFVSFEPYFAVGNDVSVVPFRLAIGGLFGTKQRAGRAELGPK